MFKPDMITKKILPLLAVVFFFASCDQDSNSIFDPDWQGDADPVISQVEPPEGAFAGIGSVTPDGLVPVTIVGNHFGTDPSNILVYFGQSRAEIIELRNDLIRVIPPNDPGENRRIRVVKLSAEMYSEFPADMQQHYELRSIFQFFPGFEDADEPQAITTGFEGELYAVNILSGTPNGVIRMDLEGEREQIVNGQGWTYYKLRHGPDGALYKIRGGVIPIIYKTPVGEVLPEVFLGTAPAQGGNRSRIQDIEFDDHGFLWAGGTNGTTANADILRIALDTREVVRFPFTGDIYALRINNDHIYVSVIRDDKPAIWRLPINADQTLGEEELFLEMPGTSYLVRDMVFTASGDMILATDSKESVMLYRNGELNELYPGVVPPGARDFAISSNNSRQLLVNIIERTVDGVTSQTKIIILEMEREMVPLSGTYQ